MVNGGGDGCAQPRMDVGRLTVKYQEDITNSKNACLASFGDLSEQIAPYDQYQAAMNVAYMQCNRDINTINSDYIITQASKVGLEPDDVQAAIDNPDSNTVAPLSCIKDCLAEAKQIYVGSLGTIEASYNSYTEDWMY